MLYKLLDHPRQDVQGDEEIFLPREFIDANRQIVLRAGRAWRAYLDAMIERDAARQAFHEALLAGETLADVQRAHAAMGRANDRAKHAREDLLSWHLEACRLLFDHHEPRIKRDARRFAFAYAATRLAWWSGGRQRSRPHGALVARMRRDLDRHVARGVEPPDEWPVIRINEADRAFPRCVRRILSVAGMQRN